MEFNTKHLYYRENSRPTTKITKEKDGGIILIKMIIIGEEGERKSEKESEEGRKR